MTLETNYNKEEGSLTILLHGDFDFSVFRDFRNAYSNDEAKASDIVIDLRNSSSLDSSALGMLLNMKEYLGKGDREIKIINCCETVLKIFTVTHFERKFDIE